MYKMKNFKDVKPNEFFYWVNTVGKSTEGQKCVKHDENSYYYVPDDGLGARYVCERDRLRAVWLTCEKETPTKVVLSDGITALPFNDLKIGEVFVWNDPKKPLRKGERCECKKLSEDTFMILDDPEIKYILEKEKKSMVWRIDVNAKPDKSTLPKVVIGNGITALAINAMCAIHKHERQRQSVNMESDFERTGVTMLQLNFAMSHMQVQESLHRLISTCEGDKDRAMDELNKVRRNWTTGDNLNSEIVEAFKPAPNYNKPAKAAGFKPVDPLFEDNKVVLLLEASSPEYMAVRFKDLAIGMRYWQPYLIPGKETHCTGCLMVKVSNHKAFSIEERRIFKSDKGKRAVLVLREDLGPHDFEYNLVMTKDPDWNVPKEFTFDQVTIGKYFKGEDTSLYLKIGDESVFEFDSSNILKDFKSLNLQGKFFVLDKIKKHR